MSGVVYKGWVPTLTGRLSFKHFGVAKKPIRAVRRLRQFDDGGLLAVAFQRRKPKDSILPEWIRKRRGIYSTFYFLAVGHTDGPDNSLYGRLYVFCDTPSTPWKAIRKGIHRRKESPETLFHQVETANLGQTPSHEYQILLAEFDEQLHEDAFFSTDFQLERTGELTLSIPTSEDLFRIGAHNKVSGKVKYDPESADVATLGHQTYMFLKEICHTHQHHPDGNDTMITAHRADNAADANEWKRQTCRQLHHYVVEYKKHQKPYYAFASCGVISYLESFSRIMELPPIQALGFDELKFSIDAKLKELNQKNLEKRTFQGYFLSLFLDLRQKRMTV